MTLYLFKEYFLYVFFFFPESITYKEQNCSSGIEDSSVYVMMNYSSSHSPTTTTKRRL